MPATILIIVYWSRYRGKGLSLVLVYKNNSRNVFGHWNTIKTNTKFGSKDNFYYNIIKKKILLVLL